MYDIMPVSTVFGSSYPGKFAYIYTRETAKNKEF